MNENKLDEALRPLPSPIRAALMNYKTLLDSKLQEIVLRCGRPTALECSDKRYYLTQNGLLSEQMGCQPMMTVTKKQLDETVRAICAYSVYTMQHQLNDGYLTLRGGHRAGIAGCCVLSGNSIVNIKDITTVNIRIAREIVGCSDQLLERVDPMRGMLLCGAPSSGKTTMIRDVARALSYRAKVSVLDERCELSAAYGSELQHDMGLCDVFVGYPKQQAALLALRAMAPQYIVLDEIGDEAEAESLLCAMNSGVSFIASLHADNIEELRRKETARKLIEKGCFSQIVFLKRRESPGEIAEIIEADAI